MSWGSIQGLGFNSGLGVYAAPSRCGLRVAGGVRQLLLAGFGGALGDFKGDFAMMEFSWSNPQMKGTSCASQPPG